MIDAHGRSDRQNTATEPASVQYDLYRRMSPAEKLGLIFNTYAAGRELAMAGLRTRHPEADADELWRLWARQHLGAELFEAAYGATIT